LTSPAEVFVPIFCFHFLILGPITAKSSSILYKDTLITDVAANQIIQHSMLLRMGYPPCTKRLRFFSGSVDGTSRLFTSYFFSLLNAKQALQKKAVVNAYWSLYKLKLAAPGVPSE